MGTLLKLSEKRLRGLITVKDGVVIWIRILDMNPYFFTLLIFVGLLFLLLAAISFYRIKSLFPGSGDPANINITFSEMLRTYGQIMTGVFVIAVLSA